jgi:hypothetical protein
VRINVRPYCYKTSSLHYLQDLQTTYNFDHRLLPSRGNSKERNETSWLRLGPSNGPSSDPIARPAPSNKIWFRVFENKSCNVCLSAVPFLPVYCLLSSHCLLVLPCLPVCCLLSAHAYWFCRVCLSIAYCLHTAYWFCHVCPSIAHYLRHNSIMIPSTCLSV